MCASNALKNKAVLMEIAWRKQSNTAVQMVQQQKLNSKHKTSFSLFKISTASVKSLGINTHMSSLH